jgi:hypothetical protein
VTDVYAQTSIGYYISNTEVTDTRTAGANEGFSLWGGAVITPTGHLIADAGGNISVTARPGNINHGTLTARAGGELSTSLSYTGSLALVNSGQIVIEPGAYVEVRKRINNAGSIDIEGATFVYQPGAITAGGSFDVRDSLVLFTSGYDPDLNRELTFADIAPPPTTTGDNRFGLAADVFDLDGQTLTLGQGMFQGFGLYGGGLSNGVIDAADGSELLVASIPGGFVPDRVYYPYPSELSNVVLNTDVRVTESALAISGSATAGTGRYIVDGGKLYLGRPSGLKSSVPVEVFNRIDPISGTIHFTGTIDNTGNTITLSPNVAWRFEGGSLYNASLVGGRIEGGPEVDFEINDRGDSHLVGVQLAVDLTSVSDGLSVIDGLTLDQSVIRIGRDGASGQLWFRGVQTLDGEGSVTFASDGPDLRGIPRYSSLMITPVDMTGPVGGSLTIGPDVDINATSATILITDGRHPASSVAPSTLINQGTIYAPAGEHAFITESIGAFENAGTLVGGNIKLKADRVRLGGLTQLRTSGSSLTVDSPDAELSGTLDTRLSPTLGTRLSPTLEIVQDALKVSGVIRVDGRADDVGFNIVGDLGLMPSGRLTLATSPNFLLPPQWIVDVQGDIALAGKLEILDAGFVDTLYLIRAESLVGRFDDVSFVGRAEGDRNYALIYEQDQVIAISARKGDTDMDGDADDIDLANALANYTGPLAPGAADFTFVQGDQDGDGDIDDADLGTMFANYTGPLTTPSVPEPTSLVVMAGAAVFATRRQR